MNDAYPDYAYTVEHLNSSLYYATPALDCQFGQILEVSKSPVGWANSSPSESGNVKTSRKSQVASKFCDGDLDPEPKRSAFEAGDLNP